MMDNDGTKQGHEIGKEGGDTPGLTAGFFNQVEIGDPLLKGATLLGVVVLVGLVVFGFKNFYIQPSGAQQEHSVLAGSDTTPTPYQSEKPSGGSSVLMPDFQFATSFEGGVKRSAMIHTSIPSRPRVDVETYVVQPGDSVFQIAEEFGLKPETILWGNYQTLADNPHRLRPGQKLNILPVNGTYHEWSKGESFSRVAEYYGVDPLTIVEWPGNPFDIYSFDITDPQIEPGTMLIVPGGARELVDYGPPAITRDNPAIASTYGPGHCGTVYQGAVGVGVFIWPTTERWVSGYDYNPGANHPAIDIAGSIGNPVWAADNGVVVYAGWSNYGYGNLVVIDHGNGWQTLYAHLNSISVGCGQSVNQGQAVGGLGTTGNSSGAHLHFEMIYNASKVNPWNFLQ
ncbi:MAG: M23 family metallopeptidase [Anaerolineales bacterium]|nr:M23 family metallopeptidase [Anaerolineales bacterium]